MQPDRLWCARPDKRRRLRGILHLLLSFPGFMHLDYVGDFPKPPGSPSKFLANSSLDEGPAATRYIFCPNMALVRTILALLIAVSVATLPAAGAAAFKIQSQDATEISASEPGHECCSGGETNEGTSMATCAMPCCVYVNDIASPLIYSVDARGLMPLLPSGAFPPNWAVPRSGLRASDMLKFRCHRRELRLALKSFGCGGSMARIADHRSHEELAMHAEILICRCRHRGRREFVRHRIRRRR